MKTKVKVILLVLYNDNLIYCNGFGFKHAVRRNRALGVNSNFQIRTRQI